MPVTEAIKTKIHEPRSGHASLSERRVPRLREGGRVELLWLGERVSRHMVEVTAEDKNGKPFSFHRPQITVEDVLYSVVGTISKSFPSRQQVVEQPAVYPDTLHVVPDPAPGASDYAAVHPDLSEIIIHRHQLDDYIIVSHQKRANHTPVSSAA